MTRWEELQCRLLFTVGTHGDKAWLLKTFPEWEPENRETYIKALRQNTLAVRQRRGNAAFFIEDLFTFRNELAKTNPFWRGSIGELVDAMLEMNLLKSSGQSRHQLGITAGKVIINAFKWPDLDSWIAVLELSKSRLITIKTSGEFDDNERIRYTHSNAECNSRTVAAHHPATLRLHGTAPLQPAPGKDSSPGPGVPPGLS